MTSYSTVVMGETINNRWTTKIMETVPWISWNNDSQKVAGTIWVNELRKIQWNAKQAPKIYSNHRHKRRVRTGHKRHTKSENRNKQNTHKNRPLSRYKSLDSSKKKSKKTPEHKAEANRLNLEVRISLREVQKMGQYLNQQEPGL